MPNKRITLRFVCERCGRPFERAVWHRSQVPRYCLNPCRYPGKHGLHKVPENRVWNSLRSRCRNPKHPLYAQYGGRGITVCPEWDSFAQFYADMGPRPSPRHSIDRVNNALGYSKENCRWATGNEQARNKRSNVLLAYGGQTLPMSEWAEIAALPYRTLKSRIRAGWTVERAITAPIRRTSQAWRQSATVSDA